MTRKRLSTSKAAPVRYYRGADVPRSVIRRFARQVAERFQPDKIILFGSHAYGTPHADSDVDILVVMPTWNELSKAVQISLAIDPPFPLDIIVRTPANIKRRLEDGDLFHTHILTKGKVLYEKRHPGVGEQGRGRLSGRQNPRAHRRAVS